MGAGGKVGGVRGAGSLSREMRKHTAPGEFKAGQICLRVNR